MRSPLLSVKKKRDFKRAFGSGKSAASPFFVVYAVENGLGYNRLGLSVSKKIGCAVVRNRVKRLARESCRKIFSENGQAGFDLIFIARAPVEKIAGSFALFCEELSHLFRRLGVL